METLVSTSKPEEIRFIRAVERVRGFMEGVGTADARDVKLLELYDRLSNVVALGTEYALLISQSLAISPDLADEELSILLLMTTRSKEDVSFLIGRRDKIVEADSTFWPQDLQDRLLELEEQLDDLQETVALRLSPEFNKQLESSIEESPSCHHQRRATQIPQNH